MQTRTIVIAVGALITAFLIILSIYTIVRATYLSLPLPFLARLLLILLPPAYFLALLLPPTSPNTRRNLTSTLTTTLQSLFPYLFLVLLTLSSTSLTPSSTSLTPQSLACALSTRWRTLFMAKDATAIRRIQDALDCCGFRSTHDQAWPFPDRGHGNDACVIATGRGRSCEGVWRREERGALGVMVAVGAVGLVCQILLTFLQQRTAGARRFEDVADATGRRRIEHEADGESAHGGYLDEPEAGIDDGQVEQRVVEHEGR